MQVEGFADPFIRRWKALLTAVTFRWVALLIPVISGRGLCYPSDEQEGGSAYPSD
jgi:hypothetical protein